MWSNSFSCRNWCFKLVWWKDSRTENLYWSSNSLQRIWLSSRSFFAYSNRRCSKWFSYRGNKIWYPLVEWPREVRNWSSYKKSTKDNSYEHSNKRWTAFRMCSRRELKWYFGSLCSIQQPRLFLYLEAFRITIRHEQEPNRKRNPWWNWWVLVSWDWSWGIHPSTSSLL